MAGRSITATAIVLQAEELDEFRFIAAGEADGYLPPYGVRRLRAALDARDSGATFYLATEVS